MKKIIIAIVFLMLCATLQAQQVIQPMVTHEDSLGNLIIDQPKIVKYEVKENGEIVEVTLVEDHINYVVIKNTDYRPVEKYDTINMSKVDKKFNRYFQDAYRNLLQVLDEYEYLETYFGESAQYNKATVKMKELKEKLKKIKD